ncbi:MAG: aminotransferase class I/II-fold pyridoxal phosphate-dependent enzyme [Chloroflexota bacterium]|nr:aminotransferase class I/II-fold pyridoxal phosphate-dependent enzyme [Chloroflexota bacterium]
MADEHDRPGYRFGTRAIRAASIPVPVHQVPTAVPIYQTATFSADDSAELGDILGDRRPGYAYSRIDNPTAAAMADAIALLEGAEAGFALGSGMAAIHAAVTSLVKAGDRIVSTRAVYGSTRTLFAKVLRRFGVHTDFVDPVDLDAVEAALASGATLLYLETISNPTIVVGDLARLIELAHRHGVKVVVDNTFASPYLCRPIELGADLVVESATKWLGGHSDVVAGAVVGSRAAIDDVREMQTDMGGIVAPFSAFLVLRGIETLHVRMDRHSQTASAVARYLESQDGVRAVFYPGLPSHPQSHVAQRLLRAGGGMLALDLGERAAASAFLDALRLPPRTASLGAVQTIAVHPPSTTHRQFDDAELAASGIRPGLVRISVGLEDAEDLIADVAAGLAAARATVPV